MFTSPKRRFSVEVHHYLACYICEFCRLILNMANFIMFKYTVAQRELMPLGKRLRLDFNYRRPFSDLGKAIILFSSHSNPRLR
jgi:hypothetical protein